MSSRNEPPPAYTPEDPFRARSGRPSSQCQTLRPQAAGSIRGNIPNQYNTRLLEDHTYLHGHTHTRTQVVPGPPTEETTLLLPQYQNHAKPKQERRLSLPSVLMLIAGLYGITYMIVKASGGAICFRPPPTPSPLPAPSQPPAPSLPPAPSPPPVPSPSPVPHWSVPTPGKCVKYGTRSYQAHLLDPGAQGLQACQNTSLVWKDVTLYPDACYNKDGVVGQWNVAFDEVGCSPGWGKFYDKGCGLIESSLRGLPDNEDWMLLCRTAPATIDGRYFRHPEYCRNDWSGVHAYWHMDDSLCKGLVDGNDVLVNEALASESVDVAANTLSE